MTDDLQQVFLNVHALLEQIQAEFPHAARQIPLTYSLEVVEGLAECFPPLEEVAPTGALLNLPFAVRLRHSLPRASPLASL